MSTLTPIIISGTTDDGMRFAQLWHPSFKVIASRPPKPYNLAWMRTGEGQMFGIDSACPASWIDAVLRMFDQFRKGDLPVPTHILTWKFSQPIFTPIKPVDTDAALFDLTEGMS